MSALEGKNVAVIGGSRGVGRVIVEAARAGGANVLAAARGAEALAAVARDLPGVATLALDATDDDAPDRIFATLLPDVLVVCGGARPHLAPLHEQEWDTFAVNWNADVKASFLFCRAALRRPLARGATVVLISSGAAIGGSPLSGGYASAKRAQMFMAGYGQKEADRLGLGLRFAAIVPGSIMAETELGRQAVAGYAKYLGVAEADFVKGIRSPATPQGVADAVAALAGGAGAGQGTVFLVNAKGMEPMAPA
jgi:NAD(P)-dependent dehydrogenase (short-subunit alcohol dehydrogenase family)